MSSALTIRPEQPNDIDAIRALVRAAFAGMPYADGDEAELVDTLREQGALAVSLVAERGGEVIGQIAFSAAHASRGDAGWYALGPVSVAPAHQRAGIGSALVRAGLREISERGAAGCILTGDPAYYVRFGFRLSPSNAPPGEPPEFFMLKPLAGPVPDGAIAFHAAFHGAPQRVGT